MSKRKEIQAQYDAQIKALEQEKALLESELSSRKEDPNARLQVEYASHIAMANEESASISHQYDEVRNSFSAIASKINEDNADIDFALTRLRILGRKK